MRPGASLLVGILERLGEAWHGARIVERAKGPRGLVTHTSVRVLERGDQGRHGLRIVDRSERPRGLLADRRIAIAQRLDERPDRAESSSAPSAHAA